VIFAALAVDDIGEQESLTVLLLDATAELPPHERVHFRVLVDWPVDGDQKPRLVERADVIVQIGIGSVWRVSRFPLRLGPGVHGVLVSDLGAMACARHPLAQERAKRKDSECLPRRRRCRYDAGLRRVLLAARRFSQYSCSQRTGLARPSEGVSGPLPTSRQPALYPHGRKPTCR